MDGKEPDVSEIIAAIRAGDKNRFRELVLRYESMVFSLILRQVGDRAIANDLAQETFIRAYRGLSNFRGDAAFSTWVTRIALNVTATYFTSRRYRDRKREISVAILPELPNVPEDPAREAELERLQYFIGELGPKYREVIVLCGLEQKSYEEAAEILGVPIGTIRSRLNTARNMLRTRFFSGKEES